MPASVLSADTKLSVRHLLKIALLAVLFCCINGRICFAATYTVTQNQQLNFGTLQIPPSSKTWFLGPDGTTAGSGTLLYGIPAAGDFTIKCTSGCGSTITVNVGTNSICTGVSSFSSGNINYNNGEYIGGPPKGGLSDPGAGGKDLKVGGSLIYGTSVHAGSCTATFDIIINATHFAQNAALGFDVALAMNKNSDINFGRVSALNASTYRVSTAGVLSTVSGTGTPLYGTITAGNIQIVGSTTDGITISAGGYLANNGVTPSNAQCSYNGGAAAACAMTGVAPGAGKTLLVGVDVATDGTQAAGTSAAPTFTISVAYQ